MTAAGFRGRLGQIEDACRVRVQRVGGIVSTTVQGALKALDAAVSGKLSQVGTMRMPLSAATIPITTADIEVGIDTRTTAVSATLPSASAWAAANPNGLELTLVDIRGNAAANAITPTLNGADTFFYGAVTPTVTSNFGLLKLRPAGVPVTGWYVRGIN